MQNKLTEKSQNCSCIFFLFVCLFGFFGVLGGFGGFLGFEGFFLLVGWFGLFVCVQNKLLGFIKG